VIGLVVAYALRKYFAGGKNKTIKDLTGQTVLITGANTGIGIETAKELARMNADVIIACRSKVNSDAAFKTIQEYAPDANISAYILDLSDLNCIREVVDSIERDNRKIDYLVNNAGVMMCPYMDTKDGFEMQMGTNHIGHFLFTILLFDKGLINTKNGRVVNVSSMAHKKGTKLDVEKVFTPRGSYNKQVVYGESKLANVLFTIELQRRTDEHGLGVTSYSLHPGVVNTELARHVISNPIVKLLFFILKPILLIFFKSPLEGAQTTLHCVLSDDLKPGRYYRDCAEDPAVLPENHETKAKTLWEKSEHIVNYQSKVFRKH